MGSRIALPWALTQQNWQGVWGSRERGDGETGTHLPPPHSRLPTSQVLHCELEAVVRPNK